MNKDKENYDISNLLYLIFKKKQFKLRLQIIILMELSMGDLFVALFDSIPSIGRV